jgi:hypothetical protein
LERGGSSAVGRGRAGIYRNFFDSHKCTQNNALRFGSKLLPSSGKTTGPKTQFWGLFPKGTKSFSMNFKKSEYICSKPLEVN